MQKIRKNRSIMGKLAVAAVLLIVALLIPKFLKFSNIMNVLRQSSIIAIPAIGVTMAMITKGIDLSTSGIIAFVPMCAIVLHRGGVPFGIGGRERWICYRFSKLFYQNWK